MAKAPAEQQYSDDTIKARLAADLPHWSLTEGTICRRFDTGDWRTSVMIANAIAHLAETAFHHPELRINFPWVEVRLWTHSAGGITAKDLALAYKIEQVVGWDPAMETGGILEGPPRGP